MNTGMLEDTLHRLSWPRLCTSGVHVEETPSLLHLVTVHLADTLYVEHALLDFPLHLGPRKLWVIPGMVQDRECGAGRGRERPSRLLLLDGSHGPIVVGFPCEIPGLAIGTFSPQAEHLEANNVQPLVPARSSGERASTASCLTT